MSKKFRAAGRFVIVNDKNEILLVEQKNNWAIPGGWIDFWENLYEVIQREAEEELGIKAQMDKIVFIQDFISSHKEKPKHCLEYFCSLKNNSDFENVEKTYKTATHSFELKDVKYFSIDNFPENFKPKAFKKTLEKYLKDKQNFSCEYISGL